MTNSPDSDRINAYREEMLKMYRQSSPAAPATNEEDNWLDNRYPEPDIHHDMDTLDLPSASTEAAFTGYIRVYVFTAGGAEPIDGAQVIISRMDGDSQAVYANLTTSSDGFTPVVPLPSVDPALTLQPGAIQPYVAYTVRVVADGFQTVEHRNIPVYGDNYVTQPVAMTPWLPNQSTQEFTSGAPSEL